MLHAEISAPSAMGLGSAERKSAWSPFCKKWGFAAGTHVFVAEVSSHLKYFIRVFQKEMNYS